MVIRTKQIKNSIEENEAMTLYYTLESEISWEESIRSRIGGYTREGKIITRHDPYYTILCSYVTKCLELYSQDSLELVGIYLNYYKDGQTWCPNHIHKGTTQLIISLGAKRVLRVGKKDYTMENGDTILFGSSIHGIQKDPDIKEGRISIAAFLN